MMDIWQQIKNWWKTQSFGERFLFMVALLTSLVLAVYLYGTYMDVNGGFRGTINEDGTRTLILLMAGTIGWYFLLRRTKATEQSAKAAEQSLTAEQLTRAMEQLSNNEAYVRVGGILGLQQIGLSENTDEDERRKIARIFVAFIRKRAAKNSDEAKRMTRKLKFMKQDKNRIQKALNLYRVSRLDIEAAVNALASITEKSRLTYRNRYNERKRDLCDLQNTDLRGLRFVGTNLSEFNFIHANFSGAWLREADFSSAIVKNAKFIAAFLHYTIFNDAYLDWAKFNHAELHDAKIINANLNAAVFVDAELDRADLSNVKLEQTNFTRAILNTTIFSDATFKDTNLSKVDMLPTVKGLKPHQLRGAFCCEGQQPCMPEGFEPLQERECPEEGNLWDDEDEDDKE